MAYVALATMFVAAMTSAVASPQGHVHQIDLDAPPLTRPRECTTWGRVLESLPWLGLRGDALLRQRRTTIVCAARSPSRWPRVDVSANRKPIR